MVFIHWNGFHRVDRMQLLETYLFLNKLHSANKIYIDINGHWFYCNVMCIKFANCANISNEGGKKMSPQVEWFNSIHLIYSFKSHSALSCTYSLWDIFSRKWLYICNVGTACNLQCAFTCGFDLYVSIWAWTPTRRCCCVLQTESVATKRVRFELEKRVQRQNEKKGLWNWCLFELKQQNHRNKYNLSEFH